MTKIEWRDQPPADWFVLSVMRQGPHGWDWVVLMVDVDPDTDDVSERRKRSECFVRIPGKHRSRAAACNALEDVVATRH